MPLIIIFSTQQLANLSVLSDTFQNLKNLLCQGKVVCNMSENAFGA